eukprot:1336323-Pleurochrysis_carterae.AAC.1
MHTECGRECDGALLKPATELGFESRLTLELELETEQVDSTLCNRMPSVRGVVPSVRGVVPSVRAVVPSVRAVVQSVRGVVPSVRAVVPSVRAVVSS